MFLKAISKSISAIIFLSLLGSVGIYAANFTVNNRLDVGGGSLRQAIIDANATTEDDFIDFNPLFFSQPRTITLITGELVIDGSGTTIINAPGADLLTITSEQSGRIFHILGGRAIISGMTITDGRVPEESGGAIRVLNGSLELINSRVTNSFAGDRRGGGIYNGGNLVVRNSVISNNRAQASHGRGGGIAHYGSFMTLVNSTVSGNYASEDGGGLKLGSPARIENSLISDNDCTDNGGGIEVTNDDTTIINSTISGNSGFQGGGGIFVVFGSRVELYSSTIAFNGSGGGIVAFSHTDDTIIARNTIIAKNPLYVTNPSAGDLDLDGTLTSQGYNLIGRTTNDTNIVGDTTGNILNVDPLLTSLGNFGGATLTHKLLDTSPAIDEGDPVNFPQFDGRGFLRPADGDNNGTARTDIGAFELNANPTQTGNFVGRITSGTRRTNLSAIAHLIGKNGLKKSVSVNPFGYFRFASLPSNQSYIVYFQTKLGNIAPQTISVNTTEGVIEF